MVIFRLFFGFWILFRVWLKCDDIYYRFSPMQICSQFNLFFNNTQKKKKKWLKQKIHFQVDDDEFVTDFILRICIN